MRLRSLLPALIIFGLGLGSPKAGAALLYSGGEDVDFNCNSAGSCSVSTSALYRSGWAREAYGVGGTTSDPPTNRFATPAFTASATLWTHAQYCQTFANQGCGYSIGNSTTSNAQMLRIFDNSGNPTLIVRGTGTAGQLNISSRTAAGVFTTLVTCSSAFNTSLTQLDLYVNYGTSGEVTLYANSVAVCDFTGNVTNGDGATTLNQVEFSSAVNGNYAAWSEVVIATTDTRAMSRLTLNTVGNGNTTGFSGTNVCSAIWSATSFNDANYGYSGASNVINECTVNSSIPAGSYNVLGLVMSARALVGSSGPLHFDFVTRTGGTDYVSSDYAPSTAFTNIANYIQTVNPATSNPWAVTDFQAAGFNIGEETKP
jgi:hypothetical protein